MSRKKEPQKIIVPQGLVRDNETTVIEIPEKYKYEPVVVVTEKPTSSKGLNSINGTQTENVPCVKANSKNKNVQITNKSGSSILSRLRNRARSASPRSSKTTKQVAAQISTSDNDISLCEEPFQEKQNHSNTGIAFNINSSQVPRTNSCPPFCQREYNTPTSSFETFTPNETRRMESAPKDFSLEQSGQGSSAGYYFNTPVNSPIKSTDTGEDCSNITRILEEQLRCMEEKEQNILQLDLRKYQLARRRLLENTAKFSSVNRSSDGSYSKF